MAARVEVSISIVSINDLSAFLRSASAGRIAAAVEFEPVSMGLTRLGASDAS